MNNITLYLFTAVLIYWAGLVVLGFGSFFVRSEDE